MVHDYALPNLKILNFLCFFWTPAGTSYHFYHFRYNHCMNADEYSF